MMTLVKKFGTRKWSLIGSFLPHRNGKQCRERCVILSSPALPRVVCARRDAACPAARPRTAPALCPDCIAARQAAGPVRPPFSRLTPVLDCYHAGGLAPALATARAAADAPPAFVCATHTLSLCGGGHWLWGRLVVIPLFIVVVHPPSGGTITWIPPSARATGRLRRKCCCSWHIKRYGVVGRGAWGLGGRGRGWLSLTSPLVPLAVWQPLGGDRQGAARSHGQCYQESLELNEAAGIPGQCADACGLQACRRG